MTERNLIILRARPQSLVPRLDTGRGFVTGLNGFQYRGVPGMKYGRSTLEAGPGDQFSVGILTFLVEHRGFETPLDGSGLRSHQGHFGGACVVRRGFGV